MFDQLQSLAQTKLAEILRQTDQFSANSSEIASVAGENIVQQLQQGLQSGNFSGITELFSGAESGGANQAVKSMTPGLVSALTSRLGLDKNQANGIAGTLIPAVLNLLNDKIKSGNIDIQSVLSGLSNGSQGGLLGGLIGKFLGGGSARKSGGGAAENVVNDLLKRFLG